MFRLEEVFKNRRVFLTGHTGFKGSWLTTWLIQLGAKVSGYSLLPTLEQPLFTQLGLEKQIHHYVGDVRDQKLLQEALKREQPEIVIHLAAQALVREGYRDPVGTFTTNAIGTLNVLEALRQLSCCQAALFVTTDKVYDTACSARAYREEDPLKGDDPYSSSKVCAEQMIHTYTSSQLLASCACATARAGNVIGGGDRAAYRLIPDLISAMEKKTALTIRYPHAIRPWQHVLDPLMGYLQLIAQLLSKEKKERERTVGAWNFGPANQAGVSVEELLRKAQSILKDPLDIVIEPTTIPETTVLRLDASKARQQLKWETKLSVDEALAWTFQWHQIASEKGNIRLKTDKQISDYMRR